MKDTQNGGHPYINLIYNSMEFISITNDVRVAKYFESCGIDNIMVDLEIIGKRERQMGLNTVISEHTFEDITKITSTLSSSKCLVRVNPIHDGSEKEIEEVILRKADIIMLPMFKTAEEVKEFTQLIGNRAKKYLLLETPQALARVDDIIAIPNIDAIHIGLNDLSIGMGLKFLYEPLIGGIVEYLAKKIASKKIKYGFGGVSRLERGKLILSEHFRLGSQMVIINRDFRKYKETYDEIIKEIDVKKEIEKIRYYLLSLIVEDKQVLENNRLELVNEIKKQMKNA